MLNKKRQELIIQNLNSISSQVRLMSVEQLVNLPTMPVQDKIKHLEKCLNDSEESVQIAAKKAIGKLMGHETDNNTATSFGGQSQSSGFSSSFASQDLKTNTDNNSASPSNDNSGFELPSLFDLNNNQTNNSTGFSDKPVGAAPAKSLKFATSEEVKPDETLASKLPDITKIMDNSENDSLPDLSAFSPVEEPQNPLPISQKPAVNARPIAPHPAQVPSAQNQNTNVNSANIRPSNNQNIIDGPVDPSLPQISNSTDIAFLIQHANDLANSKPNGYLTRLFELAKSVHEEVALTALQNLFNLKDNRVPAHILELLNNSDYTSQRRFLMLKIVMDTDILT